MYSLWWPNHIVLAHISKVVKNLRVVCENIAIVHKCLILWWFEIWENHIHSHIIMMGIITFEVHPITPTFPRNTLVTIFKSILILFCFWFSLHIFLFEHIMHGHTKEREEIPNYVKPQTSQFCYAESHKCYTWLASFSGKMVIYAFL